MTQNTRKSPRQEVQILLASARAKLLRTRCLEEAAVGAAVGAFGAAAAELACILAGPWAWHGVSVRHWALLIVPAGAALGAIRQWRRGATAAEAAAGLDAKAHLQERLVTAEELARRQTNAPPADAVFFQAMAAAKAAGAQRMTPWRRSSRTAATLALALLLCLALSQFPLGGPTGPAEQEQALSDALGTVTQQQRQDFSQAIAKAAAAARSDPALARELQRLAATIEVNDAREMKTILQRLRQQGYRPLELIPSAFLLAASPKASPTPQPIAPQPLASPDRPAGGQRGEPHPSATSPLADDGQRIRVYNPHYKPVAAEPNSPTAEKGPSAAAGATVSFDDAWTAAKERATSGPAAQPPPEYRQLIHDYFLKP